MRHFVTFTALALVLGTPAIGREPPAPGTVSKATADANAKVAAALPLNDPSDFADATRGRLAQVDGGIASAGVGLTIVTYGKVTSGSVTDGGVVTIGGSAASTSVGTVVTVVLTPSWTGTTVAWTCQGTPSKFMPGSCR